MPDLHVSVWAVFSCALSCAQRVEKDWVVLFWIGVVPLAIAAVVDTVIAAVQITHFSAVTRLYLALLPAQGYLATIFYPVFGSFFWPCFSSSICHLQ
jgi:hypothetical protein